MPCHCSTSRLSLKKIFFCFSEKLWWLHQSSSSPLGFWYWCVILTGIIVVIVMSGLHFQLLVFSFLFFFSFFPICLCFHYPQHHVKRMIWGRLRVWVSKSVSCQDQQRTCWSNFLVWHRPRRSGGGQRSPGNVCRAHGSRRAGGLPWAPFQSSAFCDSRWSFSCRYWFRVIHRLISCWGLLSQSPELTVSYSSEYYGIYGFHQGKKTVYPPPKKSPQIKKWPKKWLKVCWFKRLEFE